jgi:putative phosphoribosyl transferase
MIFKNRKDAGEKLAPLLDNYKNSNALVLGIPKGGVEIAFYLSAHLQAELSVIISKKLTYPGLKSTVLELSANRKHFT